MGGSEFSKGSVLSRTAIKTGFHLRRIGKTVCLKIPENSIGRTSGFTLVEGIVAAVLVTLSVVAVVSAVNTGSTIERSNNDRRAARAVVRSFFEQDYNLRDYNTIPSDMMHSDSVVIEERPVNSVVGKLRTRIVMDTIVNGPLEVQGKIISISCGWVEANGVCDSVTLTKIYARAQ
jgi:type II secretory pathway pseudopilin PulG